MGDTKCNKDGWVKKKLGDCFSYIKNGANIKQEKDAGGIPITRIETLSNGIFNRDRLGYAGIEDTDKYESYILESGDLLFSHINSKKYIGRTVVYQKKDGEQIIHGMNLLKLKVQSGVLLPFFAFYQFMSDRIKEQIASHRKDAVNQSSISISDLKKVSLIIPSLAEQQHIVSELDCLNGIIEKQKEQLKQLDELAQSIFYDMFGDPVENEKGWEVKALGFLCFLKAGKSIKASEIIAHSEPLFYPCYGGNGIRGFINRYSHEGPFPIIGRQGALCGNVVLARGLFYATEHAVVVRPKKDYINILWLYEVLSNLKLNRLAQGVAQPGLTVSALNRVSLILPPLPLQQAFASKIEAIEHQKELIKKSIAETETLFNSRMDYYFG